MSHKFYEPAKSRLQRSELAVPGSSVMGDTVKSVLEKI